MTRQWRGSVLNFTIAGFFVSFILSCVYVIGFCKMNLSGNKRTIIGPAIRQLIKQTIVACSIEIMYDMCFAIYVLVIRDNAFSSGIQDSMLSWSMDKGMNVQCDVTIRLSIMETGSLFGQLLLAQPFLQQAATLILTHWEKRRGTK